MNGTDRGGWLKAAERLERTGESLRKRAAVKLSPACAEQNMTRRRAEQAASMVNEGRRLEELASAAECLAAEHRSGPGTVPRLLAKIRSAKDLETLRMWGRHNYTTPAELPSPFGCYAAERQRLVVTLGIVSNAELAEAAALLAERQKKRGPTREEKIRDLERGLIGVPLPGFFPTPEPVGRRMVELAEVKPGELLLEPSAGKGDLIELALEAGAIVRGVERSLTLHGVLTARFAPPDVVLTLGDFLEFEARNVFDVVLMNPPFEKGADAKHVKRAWEYLRPGGRLVAIVSEGLFFREDMEAKEFRSFLAVHKARVEKLEPGAFKGAESFRQTGVAARLILMKKG